MALEPRLHLCVFVCGIVVADNVDLLFFGHASLNQAKELQPLLVTMLVHTCADHGSRGDLQSGKQRGGSVALVIVCHCPATTLFQRQSRLGSVQCLDLTLLVATEEEETKGFIENNKNNLRKTTKNNKKIPPRSESNGMNAGTGS